MYAENCWVHVCGIWVHVCGNGWVQSMRLLAASIWKLVCVHVCGFWVHVCGNGWVQSMRLLGAKYAVVGCKSMERLGACLTVFACLTVGSYTLHVYPVAWALAQGAPAPGPRGPGPWPSLWSSSLVYGVLSLSMEFYLCLCVQYR